MIGEKMVEKYWVVSVYLWYREPSCSFVGFVDATFELWRVRPSSCAPCIHFFSYSFLFSSSNKLFYVNFYIQLIIRQPLKRLFSSLISRAYQSFDSLWTNVFKQRITSSWLMMSSKVSAPQLWCGNGRCYDMFLVWWKQVIEMSSALCGGLAPLTVLCVCPVLGWWWIQLTLFSWGLAASQNVLNHWLVAAWPSSLCPSGTIRDFEVSLKKFLLDLINSYRTRVK